MTFSRCGTFPGVLYLVPDPQEPFRRLTSDLTGRRPEAPPYRGTITDPTPHLTITATAPADQRDQAEADVTPQLPITATITQATLIMFDGTAWSTRAAPPLGA